MKFNNVQAALDFIQSSNSPADVKMELMDLITSNAQPDGEVKFVVWEDEIQSVLFQSGHDVLVTIELESVVIHAYSLSQVTTVSIQTKETIMNAQANTNTEQFTVPADANAQLEALMAGVMEKAMENSIDKILDLALIKQKAHIDEAVKKAVDAAMAAHKPTAEAQPAAAATESTAAQPEVKAEVKKPEAATSQDGMTLGKLAAYTAAAGAVIGGGFFAWQKWGSGSSTAQ